MLLSSFIINGVDELKSILTDERPTSNDEKHRCLSVRTEDLSHGEICCFHLTTNRFDSLYKKFTNITKSLEQLLGAYVNVMFSKTKRTHEGLSILSAFEPVCERQSLRSILRDAYVNLFLSNLTMFVSNAGRTSRLILRFRKRHSGNSIDIRRAQRGPAVAEKRSSSSRFDFLVEFGLILSVIRVLGAIAWSRTLLTKMEQAMDVFKVNRHIIALGNFPMISKLYNRTAKDLLVYEQILLSRWKEKIDAWKDHLNANLLRLVNTDSNEIHMTTTKLVINSNIELFSIFDEVKWFKRLDVEIPKAALVCIEKVNRSMKTVLSKFSSNSISTFRSKRSRITNLFSKI